MQRFGIEVIIVRDCPGKTESDGESEVEKERKEEVLLDSSTASEQRVLRARRESFLVGLAKVRESEGTA